MPGIAAILPLGPALDANYEAVKADPYYPFHAMGCPEYNSPVPRVPFLRALAVVLAALAGSTEPAWELAHALTHLHAQHALDSHGLTLVGADESSLTGLDRDHGHQHPAFAKAVRPSAELTAALAPVLPTEVFRFSVAVAIVRVTPPFVSNTRAGPDPTPSSQPRAPPLL